MANLQVRNTMDLSSKQKAFEDAKKMQAIVEDECFKAGKDAPPYLLQELIGKGSFGRVYKATDKNSKALVAVKIIDIEESDTLNPKLADTYSEFMKEISALKLLSDSGARNVNLILDALPVGQAMWMVTEYCAGGSVATLMKPTAPGGLQEKWIIPILREVAEAIYWVHKEGIIHRDIKCANVLVTESGSVQLCDFGVAGIVETKLDKRSTFIGTPHWMAPELFDPVPSYSTPVDIWALGCLVYEIASGLPPNVMAGFNIPQLGNYIKNHAPRLEGDQYSDEIKDLVAFCLVEDPAKRPTIEQVQRHQYIFNTHAAYPTSGLANLVKAYKVWEAQGGIRRSLFAPVGAQGPSDYASTALASDEWNFSTTVDFDQQIQNTDAQAVYDVYGMNVDFSFNDQTAQPPKPKARRRPPPQLMNAVKAPLEKLFDPNTISNYEENSRAYYGRAPPPPSATTKSPPTAAKDLPLRDDSLHSTLRESLIDLDASFDTSAPVFDMETIRAGMRAPSDSEYDEVDYNKPPLSDPADFKTNRRTQDWKFPSMAPPASALPQMTRFPFQDEQQPTVTPMARLGSMSLNVSPERAPLLHHQTDPLGMHSEQPYDMMPQPQILDNRASTGSLIDLDEGLVEPPMGGMIDLDAASMARASVGSLIDLDEGLVPDYSAPELTRPSTANSDVGSIAGSDYGSNPFGLERHASLYQPFQSNGREPSIYVSDDTDFARLANAPESDEQIFIPDFSAPSSLNGGSRSNSRAHSRAHSRTDSYGYDEDNYSANEYGEPEYLSMGQGGGSNGTRRRGRSNSNASMRQQFRMPLMNGNGNNSNGYGHSNAPSLSDMPPVPGPPSARVMQGMASREEIRDDVMRLLSSFADHLSFANTYVSSLPVRMGRRPSETYAVS